MCPPQNDKKCEELEAKCLCDNKSNCSIDQERKRTVISYPCEDGGNCVGYRLDASEDGSCEPLRRFTKKVTTSEVFIGDSDNKTKLVKRFAGGSFGELYYGELASEKNKIVAVKVEPQTSVYNSFLLQEGSVYRNLEGGPGIPKVYWFGYHGSDYRAMIMDMLGPTLEDLFYGCNQKFSMKTILLLADQMFSVMEHVHSRGYVHRDLSPSNFVIGGGGEETKIYLIDFGHAKKYRTTAMAVPRRSSYVVPKAVVGTPRFISVHAHLSHEDSPRDDLEALGYILLYLAKGALPWQGIQAKTMPEKLNKIAHSKMSTPIADMCGELPEEFAIYINYVRGLRLFEEPDYAGIRELFHGLASKLEINYDDGFDWMNITPREDKALTTKSGDDLADDASPNLTPLSR